MKRKCAVWGCRMSGQQLALQAASVGYEIIAFCSSNETSQGRQINGLMVISPEELKRRYLIGEIECILLGIKNQVYRKEVEEIIKENFPDSLPVISADPIENDYLWEIDFEKQASAWLQDFSSEVDFWVKSVAAPKGNDHWDYVRRIENIDFCGIDPTVMTYAKSLGAGSIVMDIGCGLVPLYGSRLPDLETIQILSVDPLAPFYNRINQKCAAGKVKLCAFGLFEFIANFYKENYCDVILINNALDHCIDPYKSIIECLYVLKKGGKMRLRHRRSEAVYEAYYGLHKWNIDYSGRDELIIWNQENAVNVSECLREIADIKLEHTGDQEPRDIQLITAEITKKKDFQLENFFEMRKEQRQLAFLIEGLMNWIAEHDNSYLAEL